jgi:oligosaccharide repeat unit polymerase
MVELLYLLLFALVLVAARSEKNAYGTLLTPFCLISIPMLLITGFLFFVASAYDFPQVSLSLILCDYLFFAVFFLPSIVARRFARREEDTGILAAKSESDAQKWVMKRADALMTVLVVFSFVWLVTYFISNARSVSVLGSVVQTDFQAKYTGGFNFYPRILCLAGAAYFIGTCGRGKYYKLLLAFIALVPLVLSLVKGIIFLPIIAGLILFCLINKIRIRIRKLIPIPILGVIIFFGVYMIENGIWKISNITTSDFYSFIFAKFNVYLVSGTESFNVNLISGISYNEGILKSPAFAPVINLLAKFSLAEHVEGIGPVFTVLGYINGYGTAQVNTDGFFGFIALYTGFTTAVFFSFFFSCVSYLLFLRARNRANIFYRLIYAMLAAGLFLGWFDYYFMQSFWYYLWIFFEIVAVFFEYAYYRQDFIRYPSIAGGRRRGPVRL